MKNWNVIITEEVQDDLDNFVYYLLVEKMNEQAARAVLEDYDETVDELALIAGSLKTLEDPALSGYRKIRLRRHHYYLIYHLQEDTAIVDRMFHDLQDLDKAMT
ncbi:MAG: type II toxin-antitoxin system RelE/ParE family toxin [Lachnospiraceae bacterium]|nr:type II toxin-antitoxin system RelE/ParE family toxin [Lachnospiraceae bacterium]